MSRLIDDWLGTIG